MFEINRLFENEYQGFRIIGAFTFNVHLIIINQQKINLHISVGIPELCMH